MARRRSRSKNAKLIRLIIGIIIVAITYFFYSDSQSSVELGIEVIPTHQSVDFSITPTEGLMGDIKSIKLYEGTNLIETLDDLRVRRFENLESETTYTIEVVYTYEILMGISETEQTSNKEFTTSAEPQVEYGSSQNDEGFYYYTYVNENDYYDGVNDLVGDDLMDALRLIINEGITRTSYAEAKEHLADSDVSLEDDTKVYNVYDGVLAPRVWDSTSWHREHVWPNSRLGIDRVTESQRNIASDLHNLRAVTPSVNSSRSDRVYSDGSGIEDITDDGGYYPGDDHKGDVARIILYMAVMYDELMLTDDMTLLLDESDHYTPEGARMGQLSLLLQWHKEDPVNAFERHRNDVIYGIQGNRNPFIDKPEYVHLIWEDIAIDDLIEITTETQFASYQILTQMVKEINQ